MILKTVTRLIFLILIICTTAATAQKPDSLKIDSDLLKRYMLAPGQNALPTILMPLEIRPAYIPVDLLGYKVSYWRKSLVWAINLNQSAFSNNWSGGGVSAVALGTNFDFKAEYSKKPFDYATETNLIYGISKNKGEGSRKTNDRIFLDNKVATQLSKHWFFFGSLSFESQFAKGFNYIDATATTPAESLLISNFMAPGYLTESLGLEYKPVKYFDLRLGTGTARQTFVLDTTIYHNLPANYGVGPGRTFRNDLAFQAVATIDKDLMPNLHVNARYALFIPYQQSLAYITHRLDATFTAKVNRLIAVTLNGTILYDKNTSSSVQGTEGLSLGVLYKFP
jgi:hypothetical protein